MVLPLSVQNVLSKADEKLSFSPKLLKLFKNCFPNTLETTTKLLENNESFVFTGDIPAMWLRDSSAQVRHYIPLAKEDKELQRIIEGLIQRQMKNIICDPYANAFNENSNNMRNIWDKTVLNPWIWERKYETDSLCYPVRLAYLYYQETGITSIFNETFKKAAKTIIHTFKTEQQHMQDSPYTFVREQDRKNYKVTETLQNNGKGMPVNYTGMTWSGFRPSDDACTFNYLIPSNMFAVVILRYLTEIFENVYHDSELADMSFKLSEEINLGIQRYAVYNHPDFGKMYAYETDGFGNYTLMDDANVPSLLSIPYLGYASSEDPLYKNTRKFILSSQNPYYYEGSYAKGIGSPHTPNNFIWHIALSVQGLTSTDDMEIEAVIKMLVDTDAESGYMHEGFNCNNPADYTRKWFAWSNSLFSELIYNKYLK